VPGDDYAAFLARRVAAMPGPGPILLETGEAVGRHRGLFRYTLGQRRGLGVAWAHPLYALRKDVERNALVAGPEEACRATGCTLAHPLFHLAPSLWPSELFCQTRHRQRPGPCRAELADGELRLAFLRRQGLPAPGQIGVVRDAAGRVLAAGVIAS